MPKRPSTKRQYDPTKDDLAKLAPTKVVRRTVRFETDSAILLLFAVQLDPVTRVLTLSQVSGPISNRDDRHD